MKLNRVPFLYRNDKVAIVATARYVTKKEMEEPLKILSSWGLQVVTSPNLFSIENQFAGSDMERASDLQWALDDKSIKAIFIARGGYGTLRIIDKISFKKFEKYPKWVVGFSDITVLHSHIHACYKVSTLHAPMPLTYGKDKNSTELIRKTLFGETDFYNIQLKDSSLNRKGTAVGKLVGGNLSLIYSMLGSKSDINTQNKILFIEDLDEYLYHVDRMIQSLKRAGKLHQIKGLIVGSMIEMKDNTIPFGKKANQIIYEAVQEFDFPVVFNFPAGHDKKNYPLILGTKVNLCVDGINCQLSYLN